ncbi:LamG domain-containing protein [Pirellulales bacterium]|nr:LamG domain-containing protein [Pirellulales bacterium]
MRFTSAINPRFVFVPALCCALLAAGNAFGAYEDEVLADGPIVYWQFDENPGTTADNLGSLGSGADATYYGTYAQGAASLVSDGTGAVNFSDGRVSPGNVNGLNQSGPFVARSIELWFRATTLSGRQVLFEEGNHIRGLSIYLDNGTLYVAGWNKNGGGTASWGTPTPVHVISPAVIQTSNIYHVVLVMAGDSVGTNGTLTGYLNGSAFGTAGGVGELWNHDTAEVGTGNGKTLFHDGSTSTSNTNFDGLIDEVAVFNDSLSAARIATHYAAGRIDPVAHYALDETTGTTAADSSTSGLDGTFAGGATLATAGPYPNAGAVAAQFDGVDDHVDLPDVDFIYSAGFSVAFWMKPSSTISGSVAMAGLSNGSSVDEIWIGWDSSLGLQLRLTDTIASGPALSIADYQQPEVRAWIHVAMTIDASGNGTIYRNGVPTATGFVSIPQNVLRAQNFLGKSASNDEFPGDLDDVRFYSRALTPSEVSELYGLIGHWQFSEGAGATASDSSGFANSATLLAGATWTSDCVGNTALQVDGAGGIAQTAADFDPPDRGAVAFWMRASGAPGSRSRIWGVQGDFETRQEPDGTLSFDLLGEGPPEFVAGQDLSTDGRWRHVVGVFDSDDDSFEVYVDGRLINSGVNGNNMISRTAALLTFGTRTGNTEYWEGALRDFRIYNRPLSADEIVELSGLVGHWRFDETSGTIAYESSPHSNDGTYVNGPALGQTSYNPAAMGTAVAFDGVNDYVELPHTKYMLADNGGVMFWVKINDLNTPQGLVSKDAYGFGTGGHLTVRVDSGELIARLQSTSASYYAQTPTLVAGKWKHVAVTWGDGGLVLYLDGVEVDSNLSYTGGLGASSGGTGNYEPIAVGASSWTSGSQSVTPLVHYANAAIDDLQVFARPLCAEDVYYGYRDTRPPGLRIKRWVETR